VKYYTAYIDEAGDEGFGKLAAGPVGGQSRWFALGACIVTRENDLKMPLWRDNILARFPLKKTRDLHFRDLKHEQKVVACQEVSALPLWGCVTISHKVTIPGKRYEDTFKKKGYLYNYMLRWLLERVTDFLHRESGASPASVKIVFSRRTNTDYLTMKDYLILMRDEREKIRPVRSINWSVLDVADIVVETHSKWAGLQLADIITSAIFQAFEPNVYGNYEPTYAKILKPRLLADRNGNCLNSGLTPVPGWTKCAAEKAHLELFDYFTKR
jgi:hypothetical protein